MNRHAGANGVLLLAALSAGLLFDPMGILRMALAASVMHEAGHVLAYVLCTHNMPRLVPSLGGVSLCMDKMLARRQELAVVCAGPLVNLLCAAGLFWAAWQKASYGVYFFAAVHLCMGLYNCLPFGVLDGARLLALMVPAQGLPALARIQRALLAAFFLLAGLAALLAPLPFQARCAAALAPCYLLAQQLPGKRAG